MKTKYFYLAFLLLFYVVKSNGQPAGLCCGTGLTVPGCEDGYDLGATPNNFDFANSSSGLAANQGDVIIGSPTFCSATPRAKLDVTQQVTSTNTGSIAILGENIDYGGCNCSSCPPTNGPVIGIKGLVDGTTTTTGDLRMGGWFEADNAVNCCGTTNQIAIFVPQNGGNIDVGYTLSNACGNGYLLNVNGDAYALGNWYTSDTTLKTDIKQVNNTLGLICQLHAIHFEWKEHYDAASDGHHYGFIAQEVATAFPDVVRKSNDGHLAMSYNDMIPLLMVAIQQEKQSNDSLRSQLQSLTERFNQFSNSGNNGGNQTPASTQDVTLSTANAPLLYQNTPNPFSIGTKINYYLPEGTIGATMVFIDNYGNQMKSLPLSQTGNGTINVSADNLAAGIYSYSLVVNGNVIDTKKMILQK